MASTNFIDKVTPIVSSWLNDVNNETYNKTYPDGTHSQTSENLAASIGSSLVGQIAIGTGAVARTVQSKLRESISVEDFDGATDTLKVQAAFDSGKSIVFTKNYSVTTVEITVTGQLIDFNGYTLTGVATVATTSVLSIHAGYLKLFNVSVNQNFNANYTCAIRMYSDVAVYSQWCKIYNVYITNAVLGFVYGEPEGTSAFVAPQSENVIHNLTCRAVQVPFTGNASINGYLTLIAPVLDCAPYEWAAQAGYNATTFNTNAYALLQLAGNLFISGGELLKTTTQLGYGIKAKNLILSGTTLELAPTQGLVLGNITLRDIQNCYQAKDDTAWVIDTTADGLVPNYGALLLFENCKIWRANNLPFSGSFFITGAPTVEATVMFKSSELSNWSYTKLANTTNVKIITDGLRTQSFDGAGALVGREITAFNASAVSTTQTIGDDVPYAIYSRASIIHVTHDAGTPTKAVLQTLIIPYAGWTGQVTLIPDTAFTTATAGNIALASTAVIKKALTMSYDGLKWYPSY